MTRTKTTDKIKAWVAVPALAGAAGLLSLHGLGAIVDVAAAVLHPAPHADPPAPATRSADDAALAAFRAERVPGLGRPAWEPARNTADRGTP